MKKIAILAIVLFSAWACTQQKQIITSAGNSQRVVSDSTEYEITIIDPGFDQWYLINFSPAHDRSNDYYRSVIWTGVSNWNQYFHRGRYSRIISSFIYFEPGTDYGIEVNRRLYWYFRYVEETTGIRLLR